jgi:hypothetical protein
MQLDEGPRDDLGELKLDTEDSAAVELDDERRGSNWPLIWVLLLLVAAILGVYFGFFHGRGQPEPAEPAVEPPPAAEAPAEPVAEEPPAIELPELDASDVLVRELVTQMVEHPKLASWLTPDELIRRFVAAVDNIAEGKSPRQAIGFLESGNDFTTVDRDGLEVVDPASYRRYDAIAQLFSSLDAAKVAELYRTFSPLIDQAYLDLGYPDRDFDDTLAKAIGLLAATPMPSAEVVLLPKVETWEFADPTLEKMAPPQKALLRMGPDNARAVQVKLGQVADEIGLDR